MGTRLMGGFWRYMLSIPPFLWERKILGGRKKKPDELHQRLSALAADLQGADKKIERLAVKSGGRLILVKTGEIDWVEAADNYVNLHVGRESHLLRETMTSLANQLPYETFMRISRSTIVAK